ncbi:hypothetical protein [Kordiimonas marina]|uniref:hypothetical protein n=1 Tax=Kordiimonas marina TaxID=2872312 RepID=UPI001FF4C858|nr:hypothetical protein [Kordiimonas marina]MCJ9430700.1 hypothetical protein [Kordiimonas marina]
MNSYFLTAGLFCAITGVIHSWIGGREIATPLLSVRDMHPVAKFSNYYCWHVVSIVLFAMTGCYLFAAFRPGSADLAVLATILALAFACWNLALILWKRQRIGLMPQWAMFLAISVAGGIGFFL